LKRSLAGIPVGAHQGIYPQPPGQLFRELTAQFNEMQQGTTQGADRGGLQIKGCGHCGHHGGQGLGVLGHDHAGSGVSLLRQSIHHRRQPGESSRTEIRVHHQRLD
jgi:hypothetical protein